MLECVAGLQHDGAQYVRLIVEMAVDRLLADARRLADAVDRGPLIAVRQELPPAYLQQVIDTARLPVVSISGGPISDGLQCGSDGRKVLSASRSMLSMTHPVQKLSFVA
jgi:hypothetical protein